MLEVLILGPLEVRRDGAVCTVKSPAHRLLLAVLASERPHAVEVDRLVAALWDEPPMSAEQSLLSHVSRVRRRLGVDALERVGDGYRLSASVDADAFVDLVEEAGNEPADRAGDRLDTALALWRGRAYGDLGGHRFLLAHRDQLEAMRTNARLARARLFLGTGTPARAVPLLDSLTRDEPLHEGAWIALIEALRSSQQIADALRAAQRARRELANVGLEASSALVAAESAAIGDQEPLAVPRGEATSPIHAARHPPRPLSSFVGRLGALDEVTTLISDHRLVTLLGPGGVGKTRLALEVTNRFSMPAGDVWFCDLATVTEPDDVAIAVARAIGAPVTPPIESRLIDFARNRSALLLLDNCEHVVGAVASLIDTWLPSCGDLRVLATSRTRLSIDGERIYDVQPLDEAAAAQLFRDRAAAAGARPRSDDDAIAIICRRLDGLPLAIEMAAARARAIAVHELAGRLDRRFDLLADEARPERHRTMDEVVAWSYEGLTDTERRAFEVLSLFAGDLALTSAEAVIGARLGGEHEVAAVLAALCDRSLLVPQPSPETRYRMLETIRSFAAEHLASSADHEPATKGYIDHFLEMARTIGAGVQGPEEASWAKRALDELPNLRAAHRASVARGLAEPAHAIPAALFHFVYERLNTDVAGWACEALELDQHADSTAASTACAVAALGEIQADHLDRAASLARQGLARAAGEPACRFAHLVLADVFVYQGNLVDGAHHARAVVDAARSAGDRYTATMGSIVASIALAYQDEHGEAVRALSDARRLADSVGAPALLAYVDYAEGEQLIESDPERALALFESAAATARASGSAFALGAALLSATSVQARHGDPHTAMPAYASTIRHWLDRGDWLHVWTTLRNFAVLLARLGHDHDAALILGAVEKRTGGTYGHEAARLRQTADEVSARLGDTTYSRTISAGRRLTPTDAVHLALRRASSSADATSPARE